MWNFMNYKKWNASSSYPYVMVIHFITVKLNEVIVCSFAVYCYCFNEVGISNICWTSLVFPLVHFFLWSYLVALLRELSSPASYWLRSDSTLSCAACPISVSASKPHSTVNGGTVALQNIGIPPHNCTMSKCRRPWLEIYFKLYLSSYLITCVVSVWCITFVYAWTVCFVT